jgi:AcrR family transcriptional regulator
MVNSFDTRSKILCIANDLFGRNGFDGVSIRDIAQAADVNVASINYHFTNKNKLFQEVFLASHAWLENEIAQFAKNPEITVSELTWSTFNLFLDNGPMLLNLVFRKNFMKNIKQMALLEVQHFYV